MFPPVGCRKKTWNGRSIAGCGDFFLHASTFNPKMIDAIIKIIIIPEFVVEFLNCAGSVQKLIKLPKFLLNLHVGFMPNFAKKSQALTLIGNP